jgi:hypothetical protein
MGALKKKKKLGYVREREKKRLIQREKKRGVTTKEGQTAG